MKKFYCLVPLILLFCLPSTILFAQIDTVFWFAPPDISQTHKNSEDYIEIRLASVSDIPVTVTLSQPANSSSPINRLAPVVIPAGGSYTFNLSTALGTRYKDVLETRDFGIQNTGLLIKSTGLITAYYEVGRATSIPNNTVDTEDFNGEIFALKGSNALGLKFYTPFQTYFSNPSIYGGNSSIDIVATEDNTKVTFTLTRQGKSNGRIFNPGTPYDITLKKGQTYSIVATSTTGDNHMQGSEVSSDKPIAVTQKDDSINPWWDQYAADLVGDQLVPVNIVGTNYLVPRGFLQDKDGIVKQGNTVFIVPTQNNTVISFSDGTTLNGNSGARLLKDLPNVNPNSLYVLGITSNFPIYVYYISGYGAEMGGPLLPPINCTGSQKLSFVRSSADPFFLTVLVRNEGVGGFIVEGQTGILNSGDFTNVGNGWSVAQKRLDATTFPSGMPVDRGISVENKLSYFHLGIINGQLTNGTSRFGYFSNYNKITSKLPTIQGLCPGTMVLLDPQVLGVDSANTKWFRLPNISTPVHVGPRYRADISGEYIVNLSDKNQCTYMDTVSVQLNTLNPFDLGNEADTVCFNVNSPIEVKGTWNAIEWTKVPNGIIIPENTTSWSPKKSGIYEVTVKDNTSCVQKDQVTVTYSDSTSKFDLGASNRIVCFGTENPLTVNGGPYSQIVWSGPEVIPTNTISHNPEKSGIYKVTVIDQVGCKNVDEVNVNYDTTLSKFDLGSPKRNYCAEEPPIEIFGGPYESIIWFGPPNVTIPENTLKYKPSIDGTYKVTVSNKATCTFSDTVKILNVSAIKPDLGEDSATSCGTKRIVFNPIGGDYKLQWFNTAGETIPEGIASFTPTKSGMYKVIAFDKEYPQCFGMDSTFITFSPAIYLDFKGDSAVSCFNADFNLCGGSNYVKYNWQPSVDVPANTKECYKPIKSGKYFLTITDKYKCQKTDSVFVKYYDKIDIGLNGKDTASCFPYNSYKISLPENYVNYEWTPSVSTGREFTPIFTDKVVESYKVKITNKDGCFDTDSIRVSFIPEIKFPSIAGGDTTACDYANYTIRAGSGFAKYEWVNNVAGISDSLFIPKSSGNYWVTVYTARGGCKATSATTKVKFAPNRVIDLGNPMTRCRNAKPDTLHAGLGFETYMWENNSKFSQESFIPLFPSINKGTITDTIELKVTYEKSCIAMASKIITFIKNDTISLGTLDTIVCPGQKVTLSPGEGFLSYSWISSEDPDSVFSEASTIVVTKPATYTLFISSDCYINPSTKTVLNFDNPDATIRSIVSTERNHILNVDTVNFCFTDYTTLKVKSGYPQYKWTELQSESEYAPDNQLVINDAGIYQVIVTDENNCKSIDYVVASTNDSCFKIPNLFTPNNDNRNDAFTIAGIQRNVWNLEVYNRWGERVYVSKGYNNDWEAKEVSDGVYYYYLENPKNDRNFKGWVQIVRKQ